LNNYVNVRDFAQSLTEKNTPQAMIQVTIPNGLRLCNKISHSFGDQKLIELFRLIARESKLTDLNFLRRGPDFYFSVPGDQAEEVKARLQESLDNYAKELLKDQTFPDGEITIPHAVIQSVLIEPNKEQPIAPTVADSMDSLNEQSFAVIKKMQHDFLLKNHLTEGLKNYFIDYYNLNDKRGFVRVGQIFDLPGVVEDLQQLYQVLVLTSDEDKKSKTKAAILTAILEGLDIHSTAV